MIQFLARKTRLERIKERGDGYARLFPILRTIVHTPCARSFPTLCTIVHTSGLGSGVKQGRPRRAPLRVSYLDQS